jgi:hypothetical protein
MATGGCGEFFLALFFALLRLPVTRLLVPIIFNFSELTIARAILLLRDYSTGFAEHAKTAKVQAGYVSSN